MSFVLSILFQVKETDLSNVILDYNLPSGDDTHNRCDELKRVINVNWRSIRILFSKYFIKSCLIMLAIKTALLIFG